MLQYASLDEAWQASPALRKKKKVRRDVPGNGMVDEAANRFPSAAPWTDNLTEDAFASFGFAASKSVTAEYKPFPEGSDSGDVTMQSRSGEFSRTDAPLAGHVGPPRRTPSAVQVPFALPTAINAVDRHAEDPSEVVYDVVLYVFSGIVLILLLEQFVQMGVALAGKTRLS